MNPNIFREYDIRGVVGRDLTPEAVRALGRGFGTYFHRAGVKRISLGRDGRHSSPSLRNDLLQGLNAAGMDVVDLGLVPTPVQYYSTHRLSVGGGVMITGSHNPPDYNGFKLSLGTESLFGERILAIRDLIFKDDLDSGRGSLEEYNIVPEYIADLVGRLKLRRPVRLAVDPGNGVGGLTSEPVLCGLGCEPMMLNARVDGSFPAHHPDPTVEANLTQLKDAVKANGLELGVGYDGDADRIGIVDEKGGVMWGDQILAVLARAVLKVKPGSRIIGEVKCSQLLYDDIAKHGGKPEMWKVGHSLLKQRMKETGAELAGEMSGHIFFKHRYYGFDDAVYVTGRFLEIVAEAETSVSQFLADWPTVYNTPEIRISSSDETKFELVKRVRDYFRLKYETIDVDGMRVKMPGGWGLLRPSNTQPVVVLRFEADSPESLNSIRDEVETVLGSIQKTL